MSSDLGVEGGGARNASLDVLKLVLAIMVVLLHGDFLHETGSLLAFFLHDGLFRIAVPTFFIINGYFLEPHLRRFPAGWMGRMGCLYVFWTLVYLPNILSGRTVIPSSPLECLVIGYFHLWYVNAMIGAALLLWLISSGRLGQTTSRFLPLIAGACFAIGVGLQYIALYGWFPGSPIARLVSHFWAYRNFLFFGFPFVTLGFLIARHEARVFALPRPSLPVMWLACAALVFEWAIKFAYTPLQSQFDMPASIALAAPALFLWAKSRQVAINGRTLSKASSAIYFVHVGLFQLSGPVVQLPTTIRGLMVIAVALLFSPILFWLNRRLPVL